METSFHWHRKAERTFRGSNLEIFQLTSSANVSFQIVFLKAASDVYEAQIAVDDVLLTGCELAQAESECEGERPVRCGNGVTSHFSLLTFLTD